MFEERTCKNCNGTEYKVLASAKIGGFCARGENDDAHWFCPTCAWGSGERLAGESAA